MAHKVDEFLLKTALIIALFILTIIPAKAQLFENDPIQLDKEIPDYDKCVDNKCIIEHVAAAWILDFNSYAVYANIYNYHLESGIRKMDLEKENVRVYLTCNKSYASIKVGEDPTHMREDYSDTGSQNDVEYLMRKFLWEKICK